MVILDYKKLPEETEEQFILRVCRDKPIIGTWEDLASILNNELGKNHSESRYRKFWKKNGDVFNSVDSSSVSEFEEQRRLLERERIKYRDERRAWNKQNYTDSRIEEKLDLLGEELITIGKKIFPPHKSEIKIDSDNDLLVLLSDWHIGTTYNSIWGEYNSDIARTRLTKLLKEILIIQKRHNSQKIYLACLGDMISGAIHKNIQITNAENVVEQIKLTTELLCGFAFELSNHFEHVYISSVSGNHSRIDKKEDAQHSERLDDLITWATKLCLNGISNIHILDRNLDIGIADINIRGNTYISLHGDYDKYNKGGVTNLCTFLGFVPYALLFGHLHTCAIDETNGVKMIRGGCLGGSGDDYTIEKRLSGKPSQMVCVCDDKGVVCYYPVELN